MSPISEATVFSWLEGAHRAALARRKEEPNGRGG